MKRILVALDGSPRARGVLDAAIALAGALGAGITIFRAVGLQADLSKEAFTMAPEELLLFIKRNAHTELEELLPLVPVALRRGVRVEVGTPWVVIERFAEEEEIDLIVIGSHGYHGFDRVLGTTAARVVNHATRSVLVVRAPERLTKSVESQS